MAARRRCGQWCSPACSLVWQSREGTLSIHSITPRRRERYYWATVFATFALGTALGDFTASVVNLGYGASGIMFGIVILLPLVAWRLGANPILTFWSAYVITRPLGASFADYVSKSPHISGICFGGGPTAAVPAAVLAVFVAYLVVTARVDGATRPSGAVPGTSVEAADRL